MTNDFYDFSSTPLKLRRSRRSLVGSDPTAKQPGLRPTHHPRTLSVDSAARSQLSRTPREQRPGPHLNREAAGNNTLSIIVDNADEASSKPESPTRTDVPDVSGLRFSAPPSPRPANMDASRSNTAGKERQSAEPESFIESFKFMEDADDLDLRLQLDTFNEIPEEETMETTPKRAKHRHPSFRRNFSLSKINLNRSSQPPPSRPETKDRSATPTSPPPTLSNPVSPNHGRRRSRALSLRGARPSIAEGMATPATSAPIDPEAAHYQDPDARLKLRVYLASPQKFDEAVEFGFPSAEAAPAKRKNEPHPLRKQQSRLELADDSAARKEQGLPADDKSSVYSDASVPEPDSPQTPEPLDRAPPRPFRPASDAGAAKAARHHDHSGSLASSREMTLRMTLTRPDLRACEDQIYGWKQKGGARRPQQQAAAVPEEAERATSPPVVYVREGSTKDSIERQFAAMDAWAEPERGVVKRFWDKVRRV